MKNRNVFIILGIILFLNLLFFPYFMETEKPLSTDCVATRDRTTYPTHIQYFVGGTPTYGPDFLNATIIPGNKCPRKYETITTRKNFAAWNNDVRLLHIYERDWGRFLINFGLSSVLVVGITTLLLDRDPKEGKGKKNS